MIGAAEIKTGTAVFRVPVLIVAFLVWMNKDGFTQLFTIDGASIFLQSGTTIYIQGDILNQNGGTVDNSGTIAFTGDWTNNGGNSFFVNGSPGKVVTAGINQLILGSDPTSFYDFSLDSTGTKLMGTDASVDGTLHLWNSILNTNAVFMTVYNTALNAVQRDTAGFVASLINGALIRYMDSTLSYEFPVGGISPLRYRPIELRPTANIPSAFRVRMANNSPTNEGFPVFIKENALCKVNNQYFHEIRQIMGGIASDLTMYYDTTADGNFNTMAHWQNIPEWQYMGQPVKVLNAPPVFSSMKIPGWIGFSPTPFALASTGSMIFLGNDTTLCTPDSLMLSPGPGFQSYLWSDSSSGSSLTVDTSGTYFVIIDDSSGCTISDTILITAVVSPLVNLGNDTSMCSNDSLLLDAGYPGSVYTWSTGATTQATSVVGGGTIFVDLTVSGGCHGKDTIVITPIQAPTVNLGNDTSVCLGDTVLLDAGNAGLTFLWSTNATTQTINVTSTNQYIVTVDDGTCDASDTIQVNVLQVPVAAFNMDTSNSPLVQFTDVSSGLPISWSWNFGDGGTSAFKNPSHTYLLPGTYTITLIVDNGCGKDTLQRSLIITVPGFGAEIPVVLKAWPNPTSGNIKVEWGGIFVDELQISDVFGRILYSSGKMDGNQLNSGNLEIDFCQYSSATYTLVVKAENKCFRRKIVRI